MEHNENDSPEEKDLDLDDEELSDEEQALLDNMKRQLSEACDANPQFKEIVDYIYEVVDSYDPEDEDNPFNFDLCELDGQEYIITREFRFKGKIYDCLVAFGNVFDVRFMRLETEDGEEYLVELDSDEELEQVAQYYYKIVLQELERMKKLQENEEE